MKSAKECPPTREYASLAELARSERRGERGCATGEPVPAYGNAVFSEEPPTPLRSRSGPRFPAAKHSSWTRKASSEGNKPPTQAT